MPIPYPRQSSHTSSASESVSSSDESDYDEREEAAMIQEEWEESLRQMEVVLSIVVVPFFAKWYGRRFSYWAFDRYLRYGWTKAFFGLRAG